MVIGKATPYWQSWNFLVEVDGKPIAGFQKCSGIGWKRSVVKFKEAGVDGISDQSHGPEEPKDVTLERGVTKDSYFWDWRQSIKDGNPDDLRTFTIAQQHGGKVVERIKLGNCAFGDFEAGDFDRTSEDKVRMQKVVLSPQTIEHEVV